MGKAMSTVASGFSAVEGGLGLLGVESEKLQETMLRVQSAMALAQGLEGLEDAGRAFKQLGSVAMNALKGIRTGIAATGIGLLVVAVGTLVAYWDDIKSAMSGISAEQERLNQLSAKDVETQNEKLESLGSQDNILKLQGLSEKQILQLKIKQTDQAIKAYEISIQNQEQTLKAQVQAEKRNKAILKGILEFILAPINLLLKTVDEIGKFLGKDWDLQDTVMDWTASLIFDPEEVEEEGMKAINEQKKALEKLKNDRAGYQLQINSIDDTAEEKRKAKRKEAADKAKAERDKQLEEDKKRAEKEKEFILTEDIEDALRQQLVDSEAAKDAIRQEAIDKQQEDELALMQFRGDLYKQDVDNYDEAEAQKKQLREDNLKSGVEQARQALNLIASIAESNAGKDVTRQKKAFNIRKAANLASATIDGYKAVLSTFADTPGGPVIKGIAAAIAGAFALLQISNIAKSKFESSAAPTPTSPSGGVDGAGGASSVISPNFNIVGNAQATNPLAGLGGQPIQAYVVSGDVTTAQSLDRNRVNYATFG